MRSIRAPDPDRAILRVTGPDRIAFLQGMVTQDVNRLADRGILYAALLTPQGKYLADFFLVAAERRCWSTWPPIWPTTCSGG
jgi:tRNA-modifying protein YgfZ